MVLRKLGYGCIEALLLHGDMYHTVPGGILSTSELHQRKSFGVLDVINPQCCALYGWNLMQVMKALRGVCAFV